MNNQYNYKEQAKKYYEFISPKQYIDSKYSIPFFQGLVVVASVGLMQSFRCQHSFSLFKKAIRQALPIKICSERNLENKLVYAQGNIIKSNVIIAKDNLLNLTSSNIANLGIYRKVEIFQKKLMFRNESEQWFNINMLADTNQLNSDIQLKSQVTTNGTVSVENHELTDPLLVQLADLNSSQRALDAQMLQRFFIDLQTYSKDSSILNSTNQSIEIQQNPLLKIAQEGKNFSLINDFIYIQKSPGKISDGDIRISFHDVSNIAQVSLLAAKNGNLLEQFKQEKDINKKLEIEYTSNRKTSTANLSLFTIITEGNIFKEEFLKLLRSPSPQTYRTNILIFSLIIFSIHFIIQTQLILPFDTSNEKFNEVKRKEISKIIADKVDLPTELTQDERLKWGLSQSLLCSSVNIGLIKLMTKGFVFTSIEIGMIALMVYYYQISEAIELEAQMRKDVEQYRSEIKSDSKIQEQMNIISIFDDSPNEKK